MANNNIIIQKDNMINNNHFNTIVHKINNKQNTIQINQQNELKSVPLPNKTIKFNPQIVNNRIQNANLNTINYTNVQENNNPLLRIKQQIRPIQKIQKHSSFSAINNRGYKILIPANNNIPLNVVRPQITNIPITNYAYYYPHNIITQTNYNKNSNYVMNNSISYNNNITNFWTTNNNMNNGTYISNLQNRMILEKPIIYKTFIRYNK